MQLNRCTFVFIIAVFFLPLTAAQAQTAVDYRFLEVVDTAGKPVVDAKVETFRFRDGSGLSTQQTDEKGKIEKVPLYSGDFTTSFIRVSKSGYVTYEAEGLLYGDPVLAGEIQGYSPRGPIKIELLRTPVTAAESKAFEVERQKGELLSAVRRNDVAKVILLLKAGVDANTTDGHGIPVILWAASNGSVDALDALLGAGAEVHREEKLGRRALLYYLMRYNAASDLKLDLVRRLIQAGADVNAADKQGVKVLTIATRLGDANLVRILEIAGAQN